MKILILILINLILSSGIINGQIDKADFMKLLIKDSIVNSHIVKHINIHNHIVSDCKYLNEDALVIKKVNKPTLALNDTDTIELDIRSFKYFRESNPYPIRINFLVNKNCSISITCGIIGDRLYIRKLRAKSILGNKSKKSVYFSNY